MDLVLNDLQRLICHKTQQTKPINENYKKKQETNKIIQKQ